MTRGEAYRLTPLRGRGHGQRGARFGVIAQSDDFLPLATVLVAPTSTTAVPTLFRPVIRVDGRPTRVLAEQLRVIDIRRLGKQAGRLSAAELVAFDDAVRLVLGLS